MKDIGVAVERNRSSVAVPVNYENHCHPHLASATDAASTGTRTQAGGKPDDKIVKHWLTTYIAGHQGTESSNGAARELAARLTLDEQVSPPAVPLASIKIQSFVFPHFHLHAKRGEVPCLEELSRLRKPDPSAWPCAWHTEHVIARVSTSWLGSTILLHVEEQLQIVFSLVALHRKLRPGPSDSVAMSGFCILATAS